MRWSQGAVSSTRLPIAVRLSIEPRGDAPLDRWPGFIDVWPRTISADAAQAISFVSMTGLDLSSPLSGAQFFTARLAFQIDVSDVQAALASGNPGFILVDTRSPEAWQQGRIPGARHIPRAELPTDLDPAVPVVTYCWGPGCNGATKAALALAERGFTVREMIGGIEYWIREGFAVNTESGPVTPTPDPLTVVCGC
ncbi:hypothetical protein Sru01_59280 [Sphaerisporangium rufum]|uniref:Rhodanese domain-containing protein n=2 Tax=Sphaerisporangium rufum TaxID=1381558 RepID=A0A919R769_9ACTN|nr:hypothetical protein Sru01_59280 [Sphaerisporangium rufum]